MRTEIFIPEVTLMIKGVRKDVIFLKNTGSRVFEEAYFILKDTADVHSYSDLAEEARRIIVSNVLSPESAFSKIGARRKEVIIRFACFAAGIAVGAVLVVLLTVLL